MANYTNTNDAESGAIRAIFVMLAFSALCGLGSATANTSAMATDALGAPWPCMLGMSWCTSIPTSPVGLYVSLTCNGTCGTTYYCMDMMGTCTPDIAYSLAGPYQAGMAYVSYYSTSTAGPDEPIQRLMVMVDTQPPMTSASAILANNGSAYQFNYSTSQSVNVTLACSAMSPCVATSYCIDSANTCVPDVNYAAPVNISNVSSAGVHFIRFNSTSEAGLVEATQSRMVVISSAPTTNATGVKNDGTNFTMGTWTNANYVNVTLTCSDPGGPGCGSTLYCKYTSGGCTPNTLYTAPFKVGPLAIPQYITFSSNDTAGAREIPVTAGVLFDLDPPVTSASAVNSSNGSYAFGTLELSSYVNVTLSCYDGNGSGCNTTLYCNDTANACVPNSTYAGPILVNYSGVSYIRYRSNDTAGNLETVSSQPIILADICITGADTDGDHIISLSELLAYILTWKLDVTSMALLLKAIGFWKAGFGC